jgi:lipopolysaccharide transport system permease protein
MHLVMEILHRRELLHNLVMRNLKSRYKDSALGFLWSILTPLFMALIYMFFLRILARGVPLEEVLIGVFAWQFTAQCVGNGLTCITDNANLVKKVYFPRIILPLATTLSNLVNFLLTLVVQFVLLAALFAWRHTTIDWHVVYIPLLILGHTAFCLALAVFLSCINVYFRDIQHLVNVGMTAWFFLTPAMYSMNLVEQMALSRQIPWLPKIYMLNPMAVIINGYRAMILKNNHFVVYWTTTVSIIASLLFLLGAVWLFQRLQRNFSDMF